VASRCEQFRHCFATCVSCPSPILLSRLMAFLCRSCSRALLWANSFIRQATGYSVFTYFGVLKAAHNAPFLSHVSILLGSRISFRMYRKIISLSMSFPDSRSSQRFGTFFALSSGGSAPLLKRSPRRDTALPSTKALTPETPSKFVLLDV